MPVPACGNGRARAECPRARRSPLEGSVYPRARRTPLEGGATFEWAALVGRGGHRGVGRALCAFKQGALGFGFFVGFKRGLPICLRCRGQPWGPLKQLGKPHLKPAKKTKAKHASLNHMGHGPRHDDPDGPPWRPTQWSPRADSAPLEGIRLLRAGSASLEGSHRRPRAGPASLEGTLHARARSRTRVRAFNAPTKAGRRHHAPGTRTPVLSHQLPRREPIPATVGDCAMLPVPVP
jgi:hypothetical protein